MEKFFEIFKKNHKTERLELRIMKPTVKNARLIYATIKKEKPSDYKFMGYTGLNKTRLPQSFEETLQMLKQDFEYTDGCSFYIFQDNKFIGYQKIRYIPGSRTLDCNSVWFIKSARGFGFNQETHRLLEKLGFEQLNINRICRQTMAGNLASKKSIESSGYHFDGADRQRDPLSDGTFMDHLFFSKLASEYKQNNTNILSAINEHSR